MVAPDTQPAAYHTSQLQAPSGSTMARRNQMQASMMNQTQTKFTNSIISNNIAKVTKKRPPIDEPKPISMSEFVKRRMSPQDMASVIAQGQTPSQLAAKRGQQGTSQQNRFRQTSFNIYQPQTNRQASPINVINNSLNITIFKGNQVDGIKTDYMPDTTRILQPKPEQRSKTRSRARAYYTD
jgi:hypothetical protein